MRSFTRFPNLGGQYVNSPRSGVEKISLQSFRSLVDVTLDLTDLNLLFGGNNSGKTSFLKALDFVSINIFPDMNFGETSYRLRDGSDLHSFENIYSRQAPYGEIVFAFTISGYSDFERKVDLVNNQFPAKREMSKAEIKQILWGHKNPSDKEFKLEIEFIFRENDIGSNLKCINIKDLMEGFQYSYEILDGIPSGFEEEKEFWGLGEINMDDLYSWYAFASEKISNYSKDEGSFVLERLQYDCFRDSESDPYTRFGTGWGYSLNQGDKFFSGDVFVEIQLEDGNKMSSLEYDFDFREELRIPLHNFMYNSFHLAPGILGDFLKLVHMPTTREVPKRTYVTSGNGFSKDEYYGILNPIYRNAVLGKEKLDYKFIGNALKQFGFNFSFSLAAGDDTVRFLMEEM